MDRKAASRYFFAVTLVANGLIGVIGGGFAPIWTPVPEAIPGRELLAGLCAFVSLAAGAGLLAKRTAAPAALALFLYLLVWTALFKVRFIIRAPLEEVSYQSTGENVVLIAAAWTLYIESARGRSFLATETALRSARVVYGLALIAFGLSHFFYLEMTAPLVPAWLPAHVFWAYLTGCIYLGAGMALTTGLYAPLGALIVAIQITLITLLVWGPMVLAGNMSATHWRETIVSWALTAGAWVMAASFEELASSRRKVLFADARDS